MSVKTPTSRYSKKLSEMGFRPISKEVSLAVREVLPRKLSRNERRLLNKKRYAPWFTKTEMFTLATDETGQTWQGPADTDLSPLGFEDKSAETLAHIKDARSKDRRYN